MESNTPNGWTVSRPSNACVDIRVPSLKRNKDWEFWVLFSSDRHWDNPQSDQAMQKRHLDEAVARGAPVIDNGDLFCAMQGKYDPRASKSKVRPEHQVDNYLDALVSTATEFFSPYSHQIALIGDGNHETSIRKRQETDLLERLVGSLNTKTGSSIQKCGYGSWVRFIFSDGQAKHIVKLKRYHGSGGGGPVTRGVIQTNRRGATIADADIIATGHIHEEWSVTTVQEDLTGRGYVRHKRQLHLSCPTYKDEYRDGAGGWHIERGGPPKPIGATWIRFTFDRTAPRGGRIDAVAIPAR